MEESSMDDHPVYNGCISTAVNCDSQHFRLCVGCGTPIQDQYILRVAPDFEWHAGCLKCIECGQYLDETCTCYVREGKTFCKRDYTRLFGTKCSKCGIGINKNDFVMRARDKIFHVQCFKCVVCCRQLIPGDEFALRDDDLFCKADHEVLAAGEMAAGRHRNHHHMPGFSPTSNGLPGPMSPSMMNGLHTPNGNGGPNHRSNGGGSKRKDSKTTRVRTVLNEKQLLTLRNCYAANCRPDALMKEQLTEMTGLSPRVIRVWFQNKRCKDKKRSIQLKQMQEQKAKQQSNGDKGGVTSGSQSLSGMNGVPLVATEPVRNDSVNANSCEIQNYQQPAWKALSDFALQSEIEQPAFQQLMNHFSDQGQGSISDSSDICSIPSVSSVSVEATSNACTTPQTAADSNASTCS